MDCPDILIFSFENIIEMNIKEFKKNHDNNSNGIFVQKIYL